MRVDEDPRRYPHDEPPAYGSTDEPAADAATDEAARDESATDESATDESTDDEAALADVDGGEFPPEGHSPAPTDEVTAGEPAGAHEAVGVAAVPRDQTVSPEDPDDAVVAGQMAPTSALYRDDTAAQEARDETDDGSARDEAVLARDEAEAARDEAGTARDETVPDKTARDETAQDEGDRPDEADLMAAAAAGPDHATEAERTGAEPERAEADEPIETGAGAEELAPGEVPVATTIVLWEAEIVDGFRDRWQQIQLRFIDDPRNAAEQAQSLTSDVCAGLTDALTRHRGELDRWQGAQLDDTEELRVTVRRYRDLLDRLLGL